MPVKSAPKPRARSTAVSSLKRDVLRHVLHSLGADPERADGYAYFRALALAVRDRVVAQWTRTQRQYYDRSAKRVYYLSLEYLPGPLLANYLHSAGLFGEAREALADLGYDLDELASHEWDPGLGNGGLGRLASCFLDSMATLGIPAYGYGIRYDYGLFYQVIENGEQVEHCDNWMRRGNVWEFPRQEHTYAVRFYGRVLERIDGDGRLAHDWVDTETVMAMAHDVLVPGYRNAQAVNMRLWAAKASRDFNLQFFNAGDYVGAVEDRVRGENLSKVLYPSEESAAGRELRLKQQYFFVAATIQDILRRHRKIGAPWSDLPDYVAIHLNETHPSIAIPELMRVFVDEERLGWEEAWAICRRTFAYTNHTILPEALETWPVEVLGRLLPRHLQLVYEINRRFLADVPDDGDLKRRVSLVDDGGGRRVRMAHLAVVGSARVNGVSALHSEIIKESVFRDLYGLFPERFVNVTNGVTPRRWLHQCNRGLADLITEAIGDGWVRDLDELGRLEPLAGDAAFGERWRRVRRANKDRLAAYLAHRAGVEVDPDSLFDVQVKRIHEYKRQLLNLLRVVVLYHRIVDNPAAPVVPRTVLFAGKAAPGYALAKRIIALVHAVAERVNKSPDVGGRLRVAFAPNYCVSQAELIVPATDLSEQISTAGLEASGTGNMKFALNGALTIGTLDGANVEIRDAVGAENFFLFGRTTAEIGELRAKNINPWEFVEHDPELRRALEALARGAFCPDRPGFFDPVVDALLKHGDRFFVLADFRAYLKAQTAVDALWADPEEWTRRSILNVARMGWFSSDRAIRQYAAEIWGARSLRGEAP